MPPPEPDLRHFSDLGADVKCVNRTIILVPFNLLLDRTVEPFYGHSQRNSLLDEFFFWRDIGSNGSSLTTAYSMSRSS